MHFNWALVLGNALVPLLMGFIWYNPRVFGGAWMRAAGFTPEMMRGGKMGVIFGLSVLFSLMMALFIPMLVIHQAHLGSVVANQMKDPLAAPEAKLWLTDALARYGGEFRTFKHGAFHGTIAGILFALPIVGINALFERRSGRYILIHAGYWVVTLAIMGGIVSAFA